MTSPSSSRPTSPANSDVIPPLPQFTKPQPFRFKWDASSSRHRGPPSISEATESKADFSVFGNGQPTTKLKELEILEGNAVAGPSNLPGTWSSSIHGFNAISTVLNNPRNPSAPLKSSRAPAPPFTSPDLPRVRRKDFDSYLRAIGPEWEKFERNSRLGTEGIAKLAGAGGSDDGDINTPRPYPTKKNKDVPQLSTVPPVFFDPSFNLGNPRTFASVTEQDLVSNENQLHPEDISLNQILQEKLSHYMDVVEQHLTLEISARAGSFFAALSNLQELQEEGAECLARIEQLRRELKEVDNRQAKRGLDVVRLMKKRENLEVVTEGVKTVKEVGEMLTICERLVEDGSWDRALLLIGEIEALFSIEQKDKSVEAKKQNGIIISNSGISSSLSPKRPLSPLPQLEPPPALRLPSSGSGRTFSSSPHLSPVPESHNTPPLSPLSPTSPHAFAPAPRVPLRSLTSLASLPSHLQALTQEISISLGADVISLLKADLSRRTETAEVEARGDDLRERLTPLLRGLLKTEGMERTLNLYKEATLAEVRSAVKRYLPSSPDGDVEETLSLEPSPQFNSQKTVSEKSASLALQLRSMSHSDFLTLSRGMYTSLLRCIETIESHLRLIEAVVPSGLLGDHPSTILTSAAELANTRASKVISVRSEQHASLDLPSFVEFFNEGWDFVVKCEVVVRRMIVGLRGVMVNQAKAFLTAFHASRISESAKLVENEQWNQVEISAPAQHTVDLLVSAAVSDPHEIIFNQPALAPNGMASEAAIENPKDKNLRIEDRSYFVVSATVEVVILLLDYLKVVINLGMLSMDCMGRVVEFLKAFNSRTCQVVLGAGAMRSAGLKNITAKHLALASQSLSVIIALTPYVRETFRRHLSQKQAVMLVEFDKLKRDFQEHQNEIHSKLVAIMADRLTAHCKTLNEVKWDAPNPKPGVNAYMEVLIKETVTLHRVLSKYLAVQAVEMVMTQVFAAMNHKLGEEYGKIELPNAEAKSRLLDDAHFLNEKLSALNVGLGGINLGMLENVVKEKNVPRKSPFAGRRLAGLSPKEKDEGGSREGEDRPRDVQLET